MSIIGFTGTRNGLTHQQCEVLRQLLHELSPSVAHHGACLGADHDFMRLLQDADFDCWRVVHPSNIKAMTCEHCLCHADEVRESQRPLDRNADIVSVCEALLACPEGPERVRSGTWSTVRLARRKGKPVITVWPDGRVER